MSEIRPYKISVPESKIARVKAKLAAYDLPDELEDEVPWSRGPPLADIKRLAKYWADGYDWRAAEAKLNEFPQFMTKIDLDGFGELDVHFIHQKSSVKNAIPLLFLHGWPGSFIEVTKILPMLVKGGKGAPAFHVVAPSLVNFGFSGSSRKGGLSMAHQAEIAHTLMLRLGYNQYVAQGGDVGYHVARVLAHNHPESVKGHHVNLATPKEPTQESHPELFAQIQATPLSDWEKAGLERQEDIAANGLGYLGIHQTRPQTIGFAVAANPVALLAWVYDKLYTWTDDYPWTDDEILTWVSIYEFSTAGPWASIRIYYDEPRHKPIHARELATRYCDVKLGVSRFPKELRLSPKLWHHTMGPIVLLKEHDKGGHFSAWEVPEVLVGDIREMFGKGGGAFGVVEGKNGYDD